MRHLPSLLALPEVPRRAGNTRDAALPHNTPQVPRVQDARPADIGVVPHLRDDVRALLLRHLQILLLHALTPLRVVQRVPRRPRLQRPPLRHVRDLRPARGATHVYRAE